jgi:hypothetical protein
MRRWFAVAAALAACGAAAACPVCDSPTGRQVRTGLFNGGDFWFNAGVTVLPFVVFGGIVAAIRYAPLPHEAGREAAHD